MHFHFLKTFTIDLAQLQEVPCEGPALSRCAVASPLPSDPQAKAHAPSLCERNRGRFAPLDKSSLRKHMHFRDENHPGPHANPAKNPHRQHRV
jgi:hypothetical protein